MINGEIWPDNNNIHINAHGGGILSFHGRYYWFGEHKSHGWDGRLAYHGVHCYSSTDMRNWKDEGIVLAVCDDPSSPICKGCRIERPKVIYNAKTHKFVMWFHSTDKDHLLAQSGVAFAESPVGPFTLISALRPNAGYKPLNVEKKDLDWEAAEQARQMGENAFDNGENDLVKNNNIWGRDFHNGQMSRDMNIFVDDDNSAYHIYASEHNSTLHISRLSDDYLEDSGEYIRVFEHRWMEAPAMFKRQGKYYLLMSGCSSWAPNAARAAVADRIWGPWKEIGNPCRGISSDNGAGPETTFGAQSCYVFRFGENSHVAMFDLWNPDNFIDSRYLWLPVNFTDEGYEIHWVKTF